MTSNALLTLTLYISEENTNVRQVSVIHLRPQQLFFKFWDHYGSLMSQNSEFMVMWREK